MSLPSAQPPSVRSTTLLTLGPELLNRPDPASSPAGYGHDAYPQALSEWGAPRQLPRSGAWLLARTIPGSRHVDAAGAYPFFVCHDFGALAADLTELDREVVSLSVVPDPFSAPPLGVLHRAFDVVIPFKTHYVVDLEVPFADYLHRHHRRYAKRGLAAFDVEACPRPQPFATEWASLYDHLLARHRVDGIAAFSPASLGAQLSVPGCTYFRALRGDAVAAALVCYLDRGVAYAHLISTTPLGQNLRAQYALYWSAIEHFRGSARWFVLGSTPGLHDSEHKDGLGFFKSGWATATCQVYFCGRVMDPSAYRELTCARGTTGVSFFPAYRTANHGPPDPAETHPGILPLRAGDE